MTLRCVRSLSECCAPVAVVLAFAVGHATAQQPSCDEWNTEEFFRDASATTVSRCLEAGADIHARDEYQQTPLHTAARFNENPEVIPILLRAGADIHARDDTEHTPLITAAYSQSTDVITVLLEAGADIHARNDSGATPLFIAAYSQSTDVITVLLEAGADVNAQADFRSTPLHDAALNENPDVITVLLEAGADINARDEYQRTPLHQAAHYNPNPTVISVLLDAGADIHAQDNFRSTPLHDAAGVNRNPDVITALVAAGADVRTPENVYGRTPLQVASERDDPAVMEAFSERAVAAYKAERDAVRAEAESREIEEQLRAARVTCERWNTAGFFTAAAPDDIAACLVTESLDARDDQGRAPIHLAVLHGTPAIVVALGNAGADLDAADGQGRTALHLVAAFGDDPGIVTALVRAGADLDALDGKGRTALEFAETFSEAPTIVAALREAVAEANAPPEPVSCAGWNTAAFFASATAEDVARCLETSDPNARNEHGRTPMHYAAQGTSPALVTVLAQAGADLDAADDRGGWTPLHLAAWFSTTPSVVAALLAAGANPAARDDTDRTPWDYARENAALEGTPPYWRLNEEAAE